MSDVAFPDAVQVEAPDVERILPERAGDVVHHGLDRHHALRAAEAAERRVRHGVSLAAMGNDLDVFEIIGVVDVEHRAIVHRSRQVGRIAAARCQHEAQAQDPAVAVETDLVVREKVVALAGHQHVGVSIQPQLHRPPGLVRQHRGGGCNQRRLAFLAAESAAHAPALHHDAIRGDSEGVRHDGLDFGGMLRRAVQQHAAVLLRQRHGNVALEVEMVLAAHHDARGQPVRRRRDLRPRIPALNSLAGEYEALRGKRRADVEQRRQRLDAQFDARRGHAGRAH